MDNNTLSAPPTEIEVARAISCCGTIGADMIRRLAFERDHLRERRNEMEQAVISAASSIIDNLDDWGAEANHAAQVDQDYRSYRHVMMSHITLRLWHEFGWSMSTRAQK